MRTFGLVFLLFLTGCFDFEARSAKYGTDKGAPDAGLPLHCSNTVKDADESDVDCGGSCAGCYGGHACAADADCGSMQCRTGKCISRPTIIDIQPRSGPTNGGIEIVIHGTDFEGMASVSFAGLPSPSVHVDSPNQLRCTLPENHRAYGVVPVIITNDDGQKASHQQAFSYFASNLSLQTTPPSFWIDVCYKIVSVDLNGDGRTDLLCDRAPGGLHQWISKGDGTFIDSAIADTPGNYPIGTGDINGDGSVDIVAAVSPSSSGKLQVLSNQGNATYVTKTYQATTFLWGGFHIFDANGDGRKDIIIAASNAIEVMLGDGQGSFIAGPKTVNSVVPNGSRMGDFNRDGKADIVLIERGFPLQVYLGNGDGSFVAGQRLGPGSAADSAGESAVFELVDINQDRVLDIITASETKTFNVLRGKGDGTFELVPRSENLNEPSDWIASADFNGDRLPDFATIARNGYLSIYLGRQDGTFGVRQSYSPLSWKFIIQGDFDGDRNIDLLLKQDSNTASLKLLWGRGDGTFNAGLAVPFNKRNAAVLGDIDADGRIDILSLGQRYPPLLDVLLGQGTGHFAAAQISGNTTLLSGASVARIADFNGDKKPDVVALKGTDLNFLSYNPQLGLQKFKTFSPGIDTRGNVELFTADYDRDGFQDFAIHWPGGSNMPQLAIWRGHGDGTFDATNPLPASAASLLHADFDNDGTPDFAGLNFTSKTVDVLLGSDLSAFKSNFIGASPTSAFAGDFNADGSMDVLVYSGDDNSFGVMFGNGEGGLAARTHVTLSPAKPANIVAGDFDGDHRTDIAISANMSPDVYILRTTPTGFAPPVAFALGLVNLELVAADFNNDGKLDLLSNPAAEMLIYLNTSN